MTIPIVLRIKNKRVQVGTIRDLPQQLLKDLILGRYKWAWAWQKNYKTGEVKINAVEFHKVAPPVEVEHAENKSKKRRAKKAKKLLLARKTERQHD